MLLVRTDAGPRNEIRVEGDVLEAIAPDGSRQQTDIFIRSDGSVYPSRFAGLRLVGYTENSQKTVAFTDGGAVDNLAVQVSLSSDRMGQTLERWMAIAPAAYNELDIGPAHLEIKQAADEVQLEQLLSPPIDNGNPWGTLTLASNAKLISLDLQSAVGQTQTLADGVAVEVVQVYPDFRLGPNSQPESASEIFRNPAVQLTVRQGELEERWFVFANQFEPVRSDDAIALASDAVVYTAPETTASDYFRVVEGPDHELFYAALSSKGFKSGSLAVGDSVTPGWADFEITLETAIAQAQVQRTVVPTMPVAAGAITQQQGSPALNVTLEDGREVWLPWGEPTTVSTDKGDYFFAFSPKLLRLPFAVTLNDFIVERNEGSESVAMWTSAVTLSDFHRGIQTERRVWMNHPTWFNGWKLAQASWNPGDLQQSTLQLKREPWWVTALTWLGSLLVVGGIGTMFYGPALQQKLKKFKRSQPAIASVTSDPNPDADPETSPEVMSDAAA